jgi:NAD(P)-dependent dehydrogenase (short-subunit alcohol dehydrogenase family)
MQINEAVVLVTGASSGIGRATSLALGRAGARVAMAARRRERLEENAAQMDGALVLPTDLADEAQAAAMVDRTVEHFGRLDVLINNAGVSVLSRADALQPDAVRHMLAVNFIGPLVATQRAVEHMRRRHRGHIINIGSPAAFLGVPLFASYAASKAALHGWTRSLQAEWAGSEIFVTEYQPGLIATEMHESSVAASDLGDVGGIDVFEDESQSAILRRLNTALPAEKVAQDLLDCIRHPRTAMYSSPSARLGSVVALISRLRLAITSGMARTFRKRSNLEVFSPTLLGTDSPRPGSR